MCVGIELTLDRTNTNTLCLAVDLRSNKLSNWHTSMVVKWRQQLLLKFAHSNIHFNRLCRC